MVNFHCCGFCEQWHDYHRTCSITGERKNWDAEPCELFVQDNDTVKAYKKWLEE